MKLIKSVFKLILWIVGIALALVLALPLWVGPVVRGVANSTVPSKTGTAFNLGEFQLNPYVGKLHVGGVQLMNPAGFEPPTALSIGNLSVKVDPLSVAGDLIVVRDITLTDLFLSYVTNAKGESNIAVIERNATGEAKVGEKAQDAKPTAHASEKGEKAKSGKKVVIDHLLIGRVVVRLGTVSIPMPDIELRDIGRKSNGVTMEEAWDQVYAQIAANFSALGVNLNGLIDSINLGAGALNQALKTLDTSKIMDDRRVRDVMNSTNRAVGLANETTKSTLDSANNATKSATEAVNQGVDKASKAVDAIKGLF